MRTLTAFSFAVLTLALVSCSDEPTAPETSFPAYVHAVNGSYVINSNVNVAIDATTKQTTDQPAPDDSTVVYNAQQGEGVDEANPSTKLPLYKSESFVFVNNEPADTVTTTQLGGKITQSYRLRYAIQQIPLDLGRKNVVICDLANSTWTALKDTVAPFDLPGMAQYKISGALNFVGKSLGDETVTLNGQTLKTKKTQIDLNAMLYLAAGPTSIPLPIKLVRTYWFAEKLGVVKMEQKADVIDLGIIGGFLGTPVQAVPGMIQTAKRWSSR